MGDIVYIDAPEPCKALRYGCMRKDNFTFSRAQSRVPTGMKTVIGLPERWSVKPRMSGKILIYIILDEYDVPQYWYRLARNGVPGIIASIKDGHDLYYEIAEAVLMRFMFPAGKASQRMPN